MRSRSHSAPQVSSRHKAMGDSLSVSSMSGVEDSSMFTNQAYREKRCLGRVACSVAWAVCEDRSKDLSVRVLKAVAATRRQGYRGRSLPGLAQHRPKWRRVGDLDGAGYLKVVSEVKIAAAWAGCLEVRGLVFAVALGEHMGEQR